MKGRGVVLAVEELLAALVRRRGGGPCMVNVKVTWTTAIFIVAARRKVVESKPLGLQGLVCDDGTASPGVVGERRKKRASGFERAG